jgi:predicted dehydrogenase
MNRFPALRVGFAGAGMISEFHLIAWSRIAGASVVAIADPDLARAQERAKKFGIEKVYSDLDALLSGCEVDVVDIASPRETHAALVRAAARRKIPILCQKPLAPTYAEAEELARDVAGQTRLMVHENWRFRAYYRQIAAWIAEGRIGTIHSASIVAHNSGLVPDATGRCPGLERQPFFRTERRLLVAETLIHHIDVARALCGPLKLSAARLARTTTAVVGESAATMLFQNTETEAPVLVEGDMTCVGLPPMTRDRTEIIGSKATVILENDRLRLLGPRSEDIAYQHPEVYQGSFDAVIGHFVECLHEDKPFITDPADNLKTLRLVEDVYERTSVRDLT